MNPSGCFTSLFVLESCGGGERAESWTHIYFSIVVATQWCSSHCLCSLPGNDSAERGEGSRVRRWNELHFKGFLFDLVRDRCAEGSLVTIVIMSAFNVSLVRGTVCRTLHRLTSRTGPSARLVSRRSSGSRRPRTSSLVASSLQLCVLFSLARAGSIKRVPSLEMVAPSGDSRLRPSFGCLRASSLRKVRCQMWRGMKISPMLP